MVDIDKLYRSWDRGVRKPTLTYPSLKGLYQWFLREAESRGIDPEAIDFEAYVDSSITYEENKIFFMSLMKTGQLTDKELDDAYEEYKANLEAEVRKKYPEIIEPLEERIVALERTETTSKRRYKKIKELELLLGETKRKLEQERAKPPELAPIKIRVLKPFTEGIIDYTPGSVVETKDLDWALTKMEEGYAERVDVAVPVKAALPAKELTSEEVKRLEDEFKAFLMSELGRVPKDTMAEYRLTLREVKLQPFEEALKVILEKAKEIAVRETLRKKIPKERAPPKPPRIVSYGLPREEEEVFMVARVPPARVPDEPLSPLPFARKPSSEEKKVLWDAFVYNFQEKGMNAWEYRKIFEERIWDVTFKDWAMVIQRFNFLVDAITKGEELPPMWSWKGVPLPALESVWRKNEVGKRKDAIVHYTSVVIRNARYRGVEPTMEELRKELDDRNIPHVSHDEMKTAIMEAWETKDTWFTNISLEELNLFLEG